MNVFDLVASLSLDDKNYESGLNKAEGKGKSFLGKIGGGLKTAGKVAGVALGAASAAAIAITKKSVSAYAEQEQLIGGVQKLYGNMGQSLEEYAKANGKTTDQVKDEWQKLENAQNIVLKNAKQAYKTAGMDMNQYMETATSFSAALINSLGGDTEKAAKQTDVAMRAISDNYNTFGGDMSMIQGAFQGFAKQNYTMLDNLKLGYGGTKQEMERLIADANEWGKANGKASDLSIDSFSDVVTAIQQIQEKQNIAGTTAREAASTIEGSLGMVKSAWSNLIAGFSDPKADIGELINNVVDSAKTAFNNLMPAVKQALSGIATFVKEIAPIIAKELPGLVRDILPALIEAAVAIVQGLVEALPTIITVLVEQMPFIIKTLVKALIQTAPLILEAGVKLIKMLGDGIIKGAKYIYNNFDKILDKVFKFLEKSLPKLLSAGVKMITKLAAGLLKALPKVIECIGKIIVRLLDYILSNLPKLMQAGFKLIVQLAAGFLKALPSLLETIGKVIARLIATIIKNFPKIVAVGLELIGRLTVGIIKGLPKVVKAALSLAKGFIKGITGFDFVEVGANIIKGVIKGIKNLAGSAVDAAKNVGRRIVDAFKNFFGIHSPSRVMEKLVGEQIMAGFIKGLKNKAKETEKTARTLAKVYLDAKTAALLRKSGNLGAAAEVEFWKGVLEQTKKGTNAYKMAMNALNEARKRIKKSTIKDAKNLVKSLKESGDLNLKQEVSFWEKLLKTVKKGTKAYKEIKEQISKAKKNLTKQQDTLLSNYAKDIKNLKKEYKNQSDELQKALKEQTEQIKENLKATVDALEETYRKTVDDRRKSLVSSLSLFSEFKADEKIGKNALQANLKSQIDALEEWDRVLDQLEGKLGADSPLLKDLQEMGVASVDTIKSINSMSDAELKEYVWMYNRKNQLAKERAEQENKQLRLDTDKAIKEAEELADKQISELYDQYVKDMKELKKNFTKETNKLSDQLKKDFEALGVNMATGLGKGFKKKYNEVKNEISTTIANLFGWIDKMSDSSSSTTNKKKNDVKTSVKSATTTTKTKTDSATNNNQNVVTLNIYGAPKQDVNELANIINKKIGNEVRRGREAWT